MIDTNNPEVCDICADPIWMQEPFYHKDFNNKPVHWDCAMKQKYGFDPDARLVKDIPYKEGSRKFTVPTTGLSKSEAEEELRKLITDYNRNIPYTKEVLFVTGEGSPDIEMIVDESPDLGQTHKWMMDWVRLVESQPQAVPQKINFTDEQGRSFTGTFKGFEPGPDGVGLSINFVVDKFPDID